jgi:hypothetical protein
MKKSIKNLYLPGTNKNIGYLDTQDNVLAIYKKNMKYFPLTRCTTFSYVAVNLPTSIILMKKENASEIHMQLKGHAGYIYNVDTKMWNFFGCTFKTPDNLDVIEMAYIYRHWKKK